MEPPGRPPPALTEDLIESILLRIPLDDPRTLLRAALVCKCWCRLVSGAGFRRRFCELHRSPPVLGFACFNARDRTTRFSPTVSFRGICADGPATSSTSWLSPHKGKQHQILEYNVASQDCSVIGVLPPECMRCQCYPALITGEHGGLGLACVHNSKLHTWSREEAAHGWEWVPRREIRLNSLLPSDARFASARIVLGNGVDMVFMLIAGIEVFNIRLKAVQATRIGEITDNTGIIIPFSCFYTPRITLAEPSTSDELAGASQT